MSETNGQAYFSPFIPDGYTLTAVIPGVPGRWPDVRIRYRPLSADEESEVWAKQRLMPAEPMTRWYADAFATKLLDWDVPGPDGKKLPVTADNIRRLTPQFYEVLKSYLDGTQTGDMEKNS